MSDFTFFNRLLKIIDLKHLYVENAFDSELEIKLACSINIDNIDFFTAMGINPTPIWQILNHLEHTLIKLMMIENLSESINLLQTDYSLKLINPYKKSINPTISFKHFFSNSGINKYSFVITLDFKRYGKCRVAFLIDELHQQLTILNTSDSNSQKYMKPELITKFIDGKLLEIFSAVNKIDPKTYLLNQRSMQDLSVNDIKAILAIHEMSTI